MVLQVDGGDQLGIGVDNMTLDAVAAAADTVQRRVGAGGKVEIDVH